MMKKYLTVLFSVALSAQVFSQTFNPSVNENDSVTLNTGISAGTYTVIWSHSANGQGDGGESNLFLNGTKLNQISVRDLPSVSESGTANMSLPANAQITLDASNDVPGASASVTLISQTSGGGSGLTQADLDALRTELLAAIAAGDQGVITTLTNQLNSLEVFLQGQIDSLEARVTALENRVDALEANDATQDGLINDLQSQLSNLQNQVADIQTIRGDNGKDGSDGDDPDYLIIGGIAAGTAIGTSILSELFFPGAVVIEEDQDTQYSDDYRPGYYNQEF